MFYLKSYGKVKFKLHHQWQLLKTILSPLKSIMQSVSICLLWDIVTFLLWHLLDFSKCLLLLEYFLCIPYCLMRPLSLLLNPSSGYQLKFLLPLKNKPCPDFANSSHTWPSLSLNIFLAGALLPLTPHPGHFECLILCSLGSQLLLLHKVEFYSQLPCDNILSGQQPESTTIPANLSKYHFPYP